MLALYDTYSTIYKQKYLALYHALREAIVGGALAEGERLPSSRSFAGAYGLSRGTVSLAYDMLAEEGYVIRGVGSGTYAAFRGGGAGADAVAGAAAAGGADAAEEAAAPAAPSVPMSAWAQRLARMRLREAAQPGATVNFSTVGLDTAAFPAAEWNRAVFAAARSSGVGGYDAFIAQGYRPLREAIARHLGRTRGIATTAEHVVVVNGSMQALALLVQLLVDPGDPVVVEHPGFSGTSRAVEAAGGVPLLAPVDAQGIVPAPWDARVLVVTPNRQFPTGAVLPLERRQQLLRWAAERGAVIIEDDYDSEFRHGGRPLEPLKSVDREGRVVFVGTFSRTLFTGLRLGYAVVPDSLLDLFVKLKQLYEPHPSGATEQRALASFMSGGHYERHLRRMKRIYSAKYETMYGLFRERLSDWFDPRPQDAGLHLYCLCRKPHEEYRRLTERCRERGVTWADVSFRREGETVTAACFGFAGLSPAQIKLGVEIIREEGACSESGPAEIMSDSECAIQQFIGSGSNR
ncbi:PLP-dependent aminotransferase family protein [Paenibacillus thermotolerans]|uniref:MocR-like pyridoxine biosynthesis transcription factor PdxR n=1 Tax=Paenibacillus thermotolerans TaxID=3027807 RepID=UPI002368E2DA|nr:MULTISPECIES: PLP-dependent aminotransferase family protein [unclassified Paenibacillus]